MGTRSAGWRGAGFSSVLQRRIFDCGVSVWFVWEGAGDGRSGTLEQGDYDICADREWIGG